MIIVLGIQTEDSREPVFLGSIISPIPGLRPESDFLNTSVLKLLKNCSSLFHVLQEFMLKAMKRAVLDTIFKKVKKLLHRIEKKCDNSVRHFLVTTFKWL